MVSFIILPGDRGRQSAVLYRGPESLRCGDDERVLAVRVGGGRLSDHSTVQRTAVRALVQ